MGGMGGGMPDMGGAAPPPSSGSFSWLPPGLEQHGACERTCGSISLHAQLAQNTAITAGPGAALGLQAQLVPPTSGAFRPAVACELS